MFTTYTYDIVINADDALIYVYLCGNFYLYNLRQMTMLFF